MYVCNNYFYKKDLVRYTIPFYRPNKYIYIPIKYKYTTRIENHWLLAIIIEKQFSFFANHCVCVLQQYVYILPTPTQFYVYIHIHISRTHIKHNRI